MMITCKEDLINTYINNSDNELFSVWFELVRDVAEKYDRDIEWLKKNKYSSVEVRGDGNIFVNSIDGVWLIGKRELTLSDLKQCTTETKEESESLDAIAQVDSEEWKNGDDVVHNSGGTFKFIGACDTPSGHDCVLMCSRGEPVLSFIYELRKPETKQQREERERLEAAYDLYLIYKSASNSPVVGFADFKEDADSDSVIGMLAIVDETDYRKESK